MAKLVEHISNIMGEVPYDKYTFITHFIPKSFGGLEHSNSTALIFDPMELTKRDGYLEWLSLVSHEYFHTWNVKRIRPRELGPFDYVNENYTTMLWLAEGLTRFCDEAFVYQSGLCTIEEYLKWITKYIKQYEKTPGRYVQSLEESSFDAWIKLYRPDENTQNSSVSYYLKGGLVFFLLNIYFAKSGVSFKKLLDELWSHYKKRPETGLESTEVFEIIEKLLGVQVRDAFENMVMTTQDLQFATLLPQIGLEPVYQNHQKSYLGVDWKFVGERVFVKSVSNGGPAYKGGLNAGDEIVAVQHSSLCSDDGNRGGIRILRDQARELGQFLKPNCNYRFVISRNGVLGEVFILTETAPKELLQLKIIDQQLLEKSLNWHI